MSDLLQIEAGFQAPLEQLGLVSCHSACRYFQPDVASLRGRTRVVRRTLSLPGRETLDIFYKQYEYARPSWRFWGRASKAQREYQNSEIFRQLGIASAQRIAFGEQRDWLGRLRRAFLITKTIPEAMTLLDFCRDRCPDRSTPERRAWRRRVIEQVAAMTRLAHGAGFFHNDLYWRNVLVTQGPDKTPQVWWIDCPRGRWCRWPRLRYRKRLKDLAALDKAAATRCTVGERLAFLKIYLGKERLDAGDRRFLHDLASYAARRWPA